MSNSRVSAFSFYRNKSDIKDTVLKESMSGVKRLSTNRSSAEERSPSPKKRRTKNKKLKKKSQKNSNHGNANNGLSNLNVSKSSDDSVLWNKFIQDYSMPVEDEADATWVDQDSDSKSDSSIPLEEVYVSSNENEDVGNSDSSDVEISDASVDDGDDELNEPVNPIQSAKELLRELVGQDLTTFFRTKFGKNVVLNRSSLKKPLTRWFHHEAIFDIARRERLIVGEDVHLTSFQNGSKTSYEEGSRGYPTILKEMFQADCCTIRMTQPHRYYRPLAERLSLLQELFQSPMGCNAYYTPGNSQGFAPHYDDIDAFVLQLEGTKHWKVFKPRCSDEAFDLQSSKDFKIGEVKHSECVFDGVLHPGDVLYMPRSYIHYAKTQSSKDSLHITISTFQNTSWYNLLEKLVPMALKDFLEANVSVRKNLPLGYLEFSGSCRPEYKTESSFTQEDNVTKTKSGKKKSSKNERANLENKVRKLLHQLADWDKLPIDKACDLMALDTVRFSAPTVLTNGEERCQASLTKFEPTVKSKVRLTRMSTLRLVPCDQVGVQISEEDQLELLGDSPKTEASENVGAIASKQLKNKTRRSSIEKPDVDHQKRKSKFAFHCLYHNLVNSFDREPVAEDFLGNYHLLSSEVADVVHTLMENYPQYTLVEEFPCDDADHKLDAALTLYRMGLLVVSPSENNDLISLIGDEDVLSEESDQSSCSSGSSDDSEESCESC